MTYGIKCGIKRGRELTRWRIVQHKRAPSESLSSVIDIQCDRLPLALAFDLAALTTGRHNVDSPNGLFNPVAWLQRLSLNETTWNKG
jgi:hypothetical protein